MALVVTEKMIEAAARALATKGGFPHEWGDLDYEWYARIALTGAAECLEAQEPTRREFRQLQDGAP